MVLKYLILLQFPRLLQIKCCSIINLLPFDLWLPFVSSVASVSTDLNRSCGYGIAPFRESHHLQECLSSLALTGSWRKSVSRRYGSFSFINIVVNVVSILYIRLYVNVKYLFRKNVNISIYYFQIIHYNKGKGGE